MRYIVFTWMSVQSQLIGIWLILNLRDKCYDVMKLQTIFFVEKNLADNLWIADRRIT